jgi:excisionase family DNA binding protein
VSENAPRLMYDVPTAARMLSLSRSTVFDRIQHNEIASVKVGARRLLAHSDLEAFIERHRTNESAGGAATTLGTLKPPSSKLDGFDDGGGRTSAATASR